MDEEDSSNVNHIQHEPHPMGYNPSKNGTSNERHIQWVKWQVKKY